jgi:pyruvate dehydrogenase E1 component
MTDNDVKAFLEEKADWLEAFDELLSSQSPTIIADLLNSLQEMAAKQPVSAPKNLNSPFLNTIHHSQQVNYGGNEALESQLENIIRWNSVAMFLQANDKNSVGGHLSTYAGAATMLEVAFNHFLKQKMQNYGGDLLFIQGHSSPGVYARAFLEGRLTENHLKNYRRELQNGGGLPSYPHPRRMPDFWQAPSVSMGLGPLMAIQQARFAKYLENRGLKPPNGGKIWCFIGDGEMSEPEVLGSTALAGRDQLDNLIFVLHVNLVRLDGPVDANGKTIQTFERRFLGMDWAVIKVIFGSEWDELLDEDEDGKFLKRLETLRDGDFQYLSTLLTLDKAPEIRQILSNNDPTILKLLSKRSDVQLLNLKRGGHDRKKVFAAYQQAVNAKQPTVILMHTVKGYGLGSIAEGKNTAHQEKKINLNLRVELAQKYGIPISEAAAQRADFYLPPPNSDITRYLHARRAALGGSFPQRATQKPFFQLPAEPVFEDISGGKPSTTLCFVRLLNNLVQDQTIGKYVVPITPDESQTFGLHTYFKKWKVYNPESQLYKRIDDGAQYVESRDGQILQEGINEAGALAMFAAAGSAEATHGLPMIPFYIFYSMFGFQRVGDAIYAAADMLCKGFLLGATAGRTTLNGEGLQHQDGHSHLLAATVPSVISYDPAFGYELATIVQNGLQRMYVDDEKLIFYITLYNEDYKMPPEPIDKSFKTNLLRGLYRFKHSDLKVEGSQKVHLLGSGCIMQQVLQAAAILEKMNISTDIWSATSYVELTRDCQAIERHNLLTINDKNIQKSHFQQSFESEEGIVIATSDYMKSLPNGIAKWSKLDFTALGTDGFGLSETRESLRDFFEIDYKWIAYAALQRLATLGKLDWQIVTDFVQSVGIQLNRTNL